MNASASNSAPVSICKVAITWSPVSGSGKEYTATAVTCGNRLRIRSTGAAAKFSESTRSQSAVRPAN